MILKTTRWKKKNINYLINYIDNDKGRNNINELTFSIFHNIGQANTESAKEAFKVNETFRKQRKNGVIVYHEILSFHKKDNEYLNIHILEDIAQKYIEIRGNNALCFAKPHLKDTNIHIHFAFSGTEYKSSRTLRMDNNTFKRNRIAIEQYQIEHYPKLINSIVYHKEKKKQKRKNKIKNKEYQTKKRTSKELDKEILTQTLNEYFSIAKTYDKFCEILKNNGFELYKYRDKVNGIIYNKRKYRFNTLGYGADSFTQRQNTIEQFKEYQPKKHQYDIKKREDEGCAKQDNTKEFKQELQHIQKAKKQRVNNLKLFNLQANIRQKISNSIGKRTVRVNNRLLGMHR